MRIKADLEEDAAVLVYKNPKDWMNDTVSSLSWTERQLVYAMPLHNLSRHIIQILLDTYRGHYLSQRHTQDFFRSEHYLLTILSSESWEIWEKAGSKELRSVAHEMVRKILEEHKVEPLDKSVESKLEDLVEKIRRRESSSLN